jgi:hypothetical protein
LTSNQENIFRIFEKILKHDKKRVGRWLGYANKLLKAYSINGRYERHWTALDIVMELISRMCEEKRNWNQERVKDLDHYIYKNIGSIVEDIFRCRKIIKPGDIIKPSSKKGRVTVPFPNGFIADNGDIDRKIDINTKLEKCYNELLKDEDCAIVFLEWKDGKTSRMISENLGINIAEVENIKKRIRYHLKNNMN